MDALKRTWSQMSSLFQAMSPSQRLTLVAVPLVLAAAFGTLIWQSGRSSYVPLSWGKVFEIDELRSAEQTLINAGLTEFRTEGQRILVPSSDVERYNAALLVNGNLPSNSMSEFERQFEKSSIFTSREQLQALKDIALRNQMRTVLKAVPDIEDASVTWARSEARRWPERGGSVTATVSLRPKRGRGLEQRTIRSIRYAVASMVPDLSPDNVTIFDQSTANAYTGESNDDPFNDELVRRIEEYTAQYRRKITEALTYIPNVIVAVNVDVDNVKSQIVREQLVDAKQTVAVETDERTVTSNRTERATNAEPGAVSNVPRQLQTAAAPTQSSTNEESGMSSRVIPSYTVTDKELLTAMPKAVQVSISIPEDYFRDVALARGNTEGTSDAEKAAFQQTLATIKKEEEDKVRKHAMTLIPAGSPEAAVNVASVTRIEPEILETSLPVTEQVVSLVREWGGTVLLAVLGIWGLRMLSRSIAATAPKLEEPLPSKISIGRPSEAEAEATASPEPTHRDLLQSFVRDNPEATAAVIGKWIQAAK